MKQRLKILICRPDRVGDVILATPLIREIKTALPDCYLAALINPYTRDILVNNPYIDEIFIDEPANTVKYPFWTQVKLLKKYKFNTAFMLLPTERLAWMLFFAGIKKRIGVGTKLYQSLTFTKSVNRNKYVPLRHEADYCLDFLRKMGFTPKSMHTEIFLSDQEKDNSYKEHILPLIFEDDKLKKICIHPGNSHSAPNLSISGYHDLITRLSENRNYHIFITGGKDELAFIDQLNFSDTSNISVLINKFNLRELCSFISNMDLIISSSTGPMHIAAALKRPTVSFFCTLTACSPALWGPLGNRNEVITPDPGYCAKKCKNDPHRCSLDDGINLNNVINKIIEILN